MEAIGVKPKDMPKPLLRTVKSINSDKEFTSKAFKDLLQEFGINHYESEVQDFAKNAIVERYNRTLRRIMEVDKAKREPRPFTEADIARYVKNYNNDLHSTIKARPIDVYEYRDQNHQT